MSRRRMTLRRIDPWSVMKFGAVVNVCLFVIVLLGAAIVWFAIRQLGIIDQACTLATDVGFEDCAVNGANLFRYLFLLGLLWVVIQTGLFVFFAFLHNLIADLVGGISVSLSEEGALTGTAGVRTARVGRREERTDERTTERSTLGRPPPHPEDARSGSGAGGASGAAAGAASAARGGAYGAPAAERSEEQGAPSRRTPYEQQAPAAPPTTEPRPPTEPRPSETGSGSASGGWPWDPQPREEAGAGREQRDDPDDPDDDQLFGRRDER